MQKVSLEGSGLTVGGVGLTSCRWEKGSVNDFSHSWPPFGNARDQLKSILSRHHLLLDMAIINIAVFILSRNHFWPLASLAPLKSWIWQLDKCRETIWSWRRHRYPCFARTPQILHHHWWFVNVIITFYHAINHSHCLAIFLLLRSLPFENVSHDRRGGEWHHRQLKSVIKQ